MAAPNTKKNSKKTASPVITNTQIMKGWTGYNPDNMQMWSFQPFQCIPLEFKDEDWIRWNANYFESVALKELPAKNKRLQKLYNLAAGIINRSDYQIGVDNDMQEHLRSLGIGENDQTLLDQFFPIIPNILGVFLGEYLKRENGMTVQAKDPDSLNEKLEYKQSLVTRILMDKVRQDKENELSNMGIYPSGATKDQFAQEMQTALQLSEAQQKYKNFRTEAEKWAQKFIDLFGVRHRFQEIEFWAFADALIADEAIIALNLREDGFTPERLRPRKTYVNISPNKRYYSESNFVVNMEFMSIPDIINTFRNDLEEEQIATLELRYERAMTEGVIFDYQNGRSSTYWDPTQSRDWNNMFSPAMKEEQSAASIRNWVTSAIMSEQDNSEFSNEKLHRVSRIWWCSQRRVGLLTKIDASYPEPIVEQIDEHFKVTDKPVYDKSLLNEESAATLIKGEHIDWKWVNEWRYVVKIGQNIPMWKPANTNPMQDITYLYGKPIRFQFKNRDSLYDARPPIEGCRFTGNDTRSVSLVERLKPWQIDYNIVNNKAAKLISQDIGGKRLLVGLTNMRNNSILQEDGTEPVAEFIDSLLDSPVVPLDDTKAAALDSNGRLLEPRVVELSNVQDVMLWYQVGQLIKQQAMEAIGITQERAFGARAATQSATGIQQAVQGSVNQTEMYFETFCSHFMPRVWSMILEAGQYYTTLHPEFADAYLTSAGENVSFQVNRMELLMRDLFVNPSNSADVRKMMTDLRNLIIQDNTMGASFTDKIKAYVSRSPSEMMEKLQIAESDRQEQENQKYQQEQQLQQQQQQFLAQQKQQDMQFQDQELQKKLNSQERIAGSKNDTSLATMPTDNGSGNAIEAAKLQQQQSNMDSQNDLNSRKQTLSEQQHQDGTRLSQEKMQIEREKMQNDLNISHRTKILLI
jgi:hypothetical protein